MTDSEFSAMIEKHRGRLVGIVARHLNLQAADAEDIVHSALIKAWQKKDTCTGELERWLVVVCINEGKNVLVASKRYTARLARAAQVKAMRPSTF